MNSSPPTKPSDQKKGNTTYTSTQGVVNRSKVRNTPAQTKRPKPNTASSKRQVSTRAASRPIEQFRASPTRNSKSNTPESKKYPSIHKPQTSPSANQQSNRQNYQSKNKYSHVQSRYRQVVGAVGLSQTPESYKQSPVVPSPSDSRAKLVSLSEVKPYNQEDTIPERLTTSVADRQNRASSYTPTKPRQSIPQHATPTTNGQPLYQELTRRILINEETDAHKKVTREFKQKTAKLLIDHERRVHIASFSSSV